MPEPKPGALRTRQVVTIGLIAALVVVWLLWWQRDRLFGTRPEGPGAGEAAESTPPSVAPVAGPEVALDELAAVEPPPAVQRWEALTGQAPRWPVADSGSGVAVLEQPGRCEEVESDLADLCAAMDRARARAAPSGSGGGSCRLLAQAAEALARRPPDLSSELRSYESMLANVFHLFRVLGRERLQELRVLAVDEDWAEPMSLALYRWLISREACARSGRTPIRADVLYDYAAFAFQSLGGQAYLRRRSPTVEALAAFYGILIVDQADRRGHNPHGVDLRPEIRRARQLLTGADLVFTERYLVALDEVDQRWKRRTPA